MKQSTLRANLASLLLLLLLLARPSAPLSCLSDDAAGNAPVSWWFVSKLHGGSGAYAYIDASTPAAAGALRLQRRELDSPSSALGATLTQLISTRGETVRVQWNDEVPPAFAAAAAGVNASSGTSGHTKGVLGADAEGGFWLTSSLPKFPDLTGPSFTWGAASKTYGQSFLCVSLGPAALDEAARGLQFVDPSTYDSAVPAGALAALYPAVTALVAGARQAGTRRTNLSSVDGTQFTHIAKSGSTGLDLFEDVIQPSLGVALFVESWLRPPVMPSYCTPAHAFDSINVDAMQFVDADGSPARFKYTQDHSKIALAVNATSQQHWVGVGDNNRMTSQWARGGGMVFLRHAALYSPLLASVVEVENC
jgi:hypothetical protein